LSGQIHEEGYLIKIAFVLHSVEEEEEEEQEEEKVSNLCHCSEKLAIAINGLVSTHTPGTSHSQESVGMWRLSYSHKVHLLEHGNVYLHS
jgi:hypothetical protein